MRPVTRNLVVGTLVVVALLLALGALPSLLKSGDPYYLEATTVEEPPDAITPAEVTNVSQRRYPYTFAAIETARETNATGRSEPYWKGPVGFKGAFTHSPFDEMNAYGEQYPDAVRDGVVFVRFEGTSYRLEVIHP